MSPTTICDRGEKIFMLLFTVNFMHFFVSLGVVYTEKVSQSKIYYGFSLVIKINNTEWLVIGSIR